MTKCSMGFEGCSTLDIKPTGTDIEVWPNLLAGYFYDGVILGHDYHIEEVEKLRAENEEFRTELMILRLGLSIAEEVLEAELSWEGDEQRYYEKLREAHPDTFENMARQEIEAEKGA